MKIIQVIPVFNLAGAETMCETLSRELVRMGEHVIVVSLYSTETPITERLKTAGINVVYLGKRGGFDVRMIMKLWQLFRREKPDVLHTHLYTIKYALPAAILAGVARRVHTVHNVAEMEAKASARVLNHFFFHHCRTTPVALSPMVQKSVCREYGMAPDAVPIVMNGVDLGSCRTASLDCADGIVEFLHVGRFSDQKNHDMLIEAFSQLHQAHPFTRLRFVGEGEKEALMREKVSSLHLENSVCFEGVQADVHPCYQQADVFILPSKYEGIPMTLIEAMGSGLPVIATAVGGVPDMVTDGVEGLLTEVKTEQIRAAMEKMLDKETRKRMGAQAKKRSEYFSAHYMGCQYLRVYQGEKTL